MNPKEQLLSILAEPIGELAATDYPCVENLDMTAADKAKMTHGEVFYRQMVGKALRGDMKAMQEVLDRVYGKAQQHITQDININSYETFLDGCIAADEQETETIEAEIVPLVIEDVSITPPNGGGSAGGDTNILPDQGLFD